LCERGRSTCHQQTAGGDERTQHVTTNSFRIDDRSEGGQRCVKSRGAVGRHRPGRPTWPTARSVPFVLPLFILLIRGRLVVCGEDVDVVERSCPTTETTTKAQTWRERNNRTGRIQWTEGEKCHRVTRGAVSIVLRPCGTEQATEQSPAHQAPHLTPHPVMAASTRAMCTRAIWPSRSFDHDHGVATLQDVERAGRLPRTGWHALPLLQGEGKEAPDPWAR
jgi:hypothetical protein